MTRDLIYDLCAIAGAVFLIMMLLSSCSRQTNVPVAYLENCYSVHCNAGDRACDCLSESRACQNKLNSQIDLIRGA